jgi:hypothetical protein
VGKSLNTITSPSFRPGTAKEKEEDMSFDNVNQLADEMPIAETLPLDPDFVSLGLGATGMMAMLWTAAMGQRAAGVEMRGDPSLGVRWNAREDLFDQFGAIDQMMLDRYGEDGVPRYEDGTIFSLADRFYTASTKPGDISPNETVEGFIPGEHIAGTISHMEYIDDRWKDGKPNRHLTLSCGPAPPFRPDATRTCKDMKTVLERPSTFQVEARSVLILMRRYLEAIEKLDTDRGKQPRVRIFNHHRVIPDETGFVTMPDGRVRVRIEQVEEVEVGGKVHRVRSPNSAITDIGVPELFMIAQGAHSTDAERLGFVKKDVMVDHGDGGGPIVARADFVAGLVEMLVDGRVRVRIASEFDENDEEHWIRQVTLGHENNPKAGWILAQVPDFINFDPIERGRLPPGTDARSGEYIASHVELVHEFFIEHAAAVLDMAKDDVEKVKMRYGPSLFRVSERKGDSARVAPNGVAGGDTLGNGHFMTGGGAMTGMIGHGGRVREYWECRSEGMSASDAMNQLACGMKRDTEAWIEASAALFTRATPVISGLDTNKGRTEAMMRARHELMRLNQCNWRQPLIRRGEIRCTPLPPLHAKHPATRRVLMNGT